MRKILLPLLVVAVLLVPSERIQAGDAKAIIEKAIQAHGGEKNVAKLKAARARAKGILFIGAEVPFSWETIWQSPSQYKLTAEFEAKGQKLTLVQAFDGKDGWASGNAMVTAVEGKKLDDLKAQLHLRRVLMLAPLLKDKAYQLASLDDVQIDGKPAGGVDVSAEGFSPVRLYFAKDSGLLVKIERPILDDASMQYVQQEEFLSAYKEIDDVPTAMKADWHRSGKKVATLEFTDVQYPAKIDAREFAKPVGTTATPDKLPSTRTSDVIYGRKFGTALTMDVFTPKKDANGAAIVLVVSGGWVSDNQTINSALFAIFLGEFLNRGYTVFAVVHGSQPRYTIPEAITDINRAVRYIRLHAKDYKIDPDRIGITGGSAGGHLSLMLGTAGDLGNPKAADPVERISSRVQAVACFFPPTDFLNYGGKDKYAFAPDGVLASFQTAIDVREFDPKTRRFERVTDEKKVMELARNISPITHVSADDAPTLIIHGDADVLVPIQQAEVLVARFQEVGVTAELVVRKGRGHDFSGGAKDLVVIADWFDKHLKKK